MKVIRHGFKSPTVAIIGCVHGDEKIGAKVIERLEGSLSIDGSVKYIIANEEAIKLGKRFVETDLNRSFPGNKTGTHEEQIAYALCKELSGADYVLDIHSTTNDTYDFIITVGESDMSKYFPLARVVDMSGFAKGVSLIENVKNGISLEYDRKTSAEQIEQQFMQYFVNMGFIEGLSVLVPQQRFMVYGVLKRDSSNKDLTLDNFVETTYNGETFVPILSGEKAYEGIICLKTKVVE